MARLTDKLSPAKVQKEKAPGMYGDGRGLWLHVGPSGNKSWVFRFMLNGKAREMGLGAYPDVPLAEAREAATSARRMARIDGIDPIEARKTKRSDARAKAAAAITFQSCAGKYIAANRPGWRNPKHAKQWDATLATYAYPVIGNVAVAAIDTGHVTRILEPIWATKPETAARVRGRIEAVLDYARTHRWREDENPARWRGHLENVLPKRGKVRKVEHHAALPWQEVGDFVARLEQQEGMAALALRFAILTAARTGEVIGATWAEIDCKAAVWTVPAARTKAAREHRVPLSGAALDVLRTAAGRMDTPHPDAPVFIGGKAGKGLSNMAMLVLLRRMGRGDLTAHGFRSTFRDWGAETGQPADIAEAALAHVVGDKTVAAYQRGDLLARRRQLMDAWAAWCSTLTTDRGVVVPMVAR